MVITEEMIISGFISKLVSDVVDIPENPIKDAIRNADKKRRDRNQNIETRIYQVTIDAIKEFTKREYKGQDVLYDAAESIIRGFIRNKNDKVEAVRVGLKMLGLQVTSETCEKFLKTLRHVICMDENDILYKEIILIHGEQAFETVREGFDVSNKNDEKTHKKLDYVIEGISNIDKKIDRIENDEKHYEMPIKNRVGEYADKWEKNVFLNDFNKRDKNAGVNIKLKELYLEEHLPHYVWKMNDEPLDDLKELLCEYTVDNDDKKMLLILGQAGIGKSTLITWIMANLVKKKDDIYVYQFSSDLENIDWQSKNVLNDIFSAIGLEYDELENRALILDGFDEVYIGSDREKILNKLNQELEGLSTLKSFSVIITCRENYVYNLQNIDCDYIVLQAWNEVQIEIFCKIYWEKCGNDISEDTIQKILENKEVFGIPLILYMILALNIAIEKSSSIVDVYDQIFSLERGALYDRRYDSEHRINNPEIKERIYRISQKMAFWIFENNADKEFVSQEKFEEICNSEMSKYGEKDKNIQSNTLIGNFFKLKYCEGKGTDELQFVHRSIYEYFVATYFFESINKLTSKEDIAGKLGELLKDGCLSEQILEFIKYKFDRIKEGGLPNSIKDIFQIMLQDGMTFYTKERYRNIIEREMNIFLNMLSMVYLWNSKIGEVDHKISNYLRYNHRKKLNLKGIELREIDLGETHLSGANLEGADLSRANLTGADLSEANLSEANLSQADLSQANLFRANLVSINLTDAYITNANLSNADLMCANLMKAELAGANLKNVSLKEAHLEETFLIGADLAEANLLGANVARAYLFRANIVGINLEGAYLYETLFDECQVELLYGKYDLNSSMVLIAESQEIINCKEYCLRKSKNEL